MIYGPGVIRENNGSWSGKATGKEAAGRKGSRPDALHVKTLLSLGTDSLVVLAGPVRVLCSYGNSEMWLLKPVSDRTLHIFDRVFPFFFM